MGGWETDRSANDSFLENRQINANGGNASEKRRIKNEKLLAVSVNWMTNPMTETDYAKHFKKCGADPTARLQTELISKAFGQHKQK